MKVRSVNRRWAEIRVPKCGPVRFRLSRALAGGFGMARVTLDSAHRWHVSLSSTPVAIDRESTDAIVGIDRGVANTLATSNCALMQAPSLRAKEAERWLRLQS